MSHVDEGLIHAWIDGAFEPGDPEGAAIEEHLSACAECRASIDEALRLKHRASEVLQRATPDAVRVEPFDRIVRARDARQRDGIAPAGSETGEEFGAEDGAIAGGGGSVERESDIDVQRRKGRPYIPLAWAASIMVAVTAGWFANTMIQPDRAGSPTQASFEPARAVAPGTPAESVELQAEAGRGDGASLDPEALARDADAIRELPLRQNAQQDVVGRDEARRERAQEVAPPAAAPPVSSVLKAMAADSLRALLAEAEQLEARGLTAEVRLLDSAVEAEWREMTVAEAADRFGRMPFAIEGIPISNVEVLESGGTAALRIRQRVSEDVEVEIVQQVVAVSLDEVVVTGASAGARDDSARRAALGRQLAASANRAADQAMASPMPLLAAGDTTAIAVPAIGYTVVLRGPLPADSLRALAVRVR